MKTLIRISLIFLAIAITSTANTAKAQDPDVVAGKIRGHWAFPDCGRYDHAFVFTRYFSIRAARSDLSLLPYEIRPGGTDYVLARKNRQSLPVRIEDDGILSIGIPAGKTPPKAAKWDDFKFERTLEYSACATPPAVIPKAMLRLTRYIDRIHDQCNLRVDNDCLRVVFKMADDDNDGKVNAAEIRRAVTSIMLFAEMADQGTLDAQDILATGRRAQTEGDAIARDLLTRFDSDTSGDLDFNELAADFSAPDLPAVRDMLAKTGKIIPVFQMVALTLPQ